MRAMVVYESMYGNTAHVAEAVAKGIGDAGAGEASVVEVGQAPNPLPPDLELLFVGGPTHAHGMSRDTSRRDAAVRVDRPLVSRGVGIREWIEALEPTRAVDVAAFDTRVKGPELLWGSAAKSATKALRERGFRVVDTESFVLAGVRGEPYDRVAPAELERARVWGSRMADRLGARTR